MRREERLDFISRLITTKEVQTQDELVQELLANDIDVTQATVSRDIKSLALIKIMEVVGLSLRIASTT